MKKLIAVMLVLVMALGLFAACGDKNDGAPETPKVEVPATALEILEKTYAKYAEDEMFPVAGGAGENMNWEGPAAIDMAANGADLSYIVYVPEADIATLTDAATMQHAMNANTFSAAALRLKEGTDAAAFAATMKDAILSTQWMCGFPEKLIVAVVGGEYVVVAFGHDNDETPLITTFQTHLKEVYADAEILYTEDIA